MLLGTLKSSAKWSGAVYVFVRTGENWQQQAYVKASKIGTKENYGGDFFGMSVTISADGNTAAVGADYEQSAATGINGDQTKYSVWGAGAAYVFARVCTLWT